MEKIEYPQEVIDTCVKLRYDFEVHSKQMWTFEVSLRDKRSMWENFLNDKLEKNEISRNIYDICLEEFLNPKDYTKAKIEERRAKRTKSK